MKKILYISYDGLTDPLGQSQILPYLAGLTKEGYVFTILSFEKRERLQKEKGLVQAIVDAAGIDWHPLPFTAKPPVVSKIWDRYRLSQTVIRLHKAKRFDGVHCRSYVAAEVGLQLKRKFGVPMIFDMRGFWADEKVDNGQWNLASPLFKRIYQHYKTRERSFLLKADRIVSLTEAAKTYLLQKEEYKHLSITVIPTCADLTHFDYRTIDPAKAESLRLSLGFAREDKILVYLGSVGGWYLTAEMFRFFKALHQKDNRYKMLVLTKDDAQKVSEEAAGAGILPQQIVVSYAGRQALPFYLYLATCAIFFIRNSFSKIASSPTKLAELMGMGIPVICNDIGDTGGIIMSTGTGMVVNAFDGASIQEALSRFSSMEQLDKAAIRQSAKEYFDLQTGVERYLQLYKSVFSGHL